MEQMWTGFKSKNAEEDINGKYSIESVRRLRAESGGI